MPEDVNVANIADTDTAQIASMAVLQYSGVAM
jgi:hypothetical protein